MARRERRLMAEKILRVELGARSYNIHIGAGLLERTGGILRPVLGGGRIAVVTDERVAGLHLDRLSASLAAAGFDASPVLLPSGETAKSLDEFAKLMDRLLDLRLGRDGTVVAFGGGVTGDVAGFAAAALYRGVKWIQIPTTLLAQTDSSVGGKTGINMRQGKNLVGAFHQPSCVIADPDLLSTLPMREWRAGYAEIAKIALLGDAEFFAWLEQRVAEILSGSGNAVAEAVHAACAAKAEIVAGDETEEGRRALLNLGHSFGHALEAVAGYDGGFVHGEAVAVGTVLAVEASRRMGFCEESVPVRVRAHLQAAGLPVSLRQLADLPWDTGQLLERMAQDKKFRDGRPVLVLLRAVGEAFVCRTPDMDVVREVLQEACAADR